MSRSRPIEHYCFPKYSGMIHSTSFVYIVFDLLSLHIILCAPKSATYTALNSRDFGSRIDLARSLTYPLFVFIVLLSRKELQYAPSSCNMRCPHASGSGEDIQVIIAINRLPQGAKALYSVQHVKKSKTTYVESLIIMPENTQNVLQNRKI